MRPWDGVDAAAAFRVTLVLVGVAHVLAGIECAVLHGRGDVERHLPWRLARLRLRGAEQRHRSVAVLDRVLAVPRNLVLVAALRVVGGAVVTVADPRSWVCGVALATLFATAVLESYRSIMGGEGADQMIVLLTASAAVAGGPWADHEVRAAALAFIAAQAVLAYTAAGWAKVASPVWRSGRAISRVLSTHGYGVPAVGRALAARPLVEGVLTSALLGFESTFALALAGPRVAVLYVAAGLCFHVVNAALMGLNSFVVVFAATYPAVCWAATELGGPW